MKPLRYLLVYAHPERRSLNGSLKDRAVAGLTALGHEVVVSDLHAMGWKAVADSEDFPSRERDARLVYHEASGDAYHGGVQRPDILAEQEKLRAADVVVLQFPLWWFSMPAILKGWIDRVFVHGLAIGVSKPGTKQWARYGEGSFVGKRAMLAITTGGRDGQFGDRGIHGPIADILFPIHHGLFHYTGMTVVPPFVAYRTVRTTDAEFEELAQRYVRQLGEVASATPIAYRTENGGDYDAQGILKDGVGGDARGSRLHELRDDDPPRER